MCNLYILRKSVTEVAAYFAVPNPVQSNSPEEETHSSLYANSLSFRGHPRGQVPKVLVQAPPTEAFIECFYEPMVGRSAGA